MERERKKKDFFFIITISCGNDFIRRNGKNMNIMMILHDGKTRKRIAPWLNRKGLD